MLYTGLASNLPRRFAEHNGLVQHAGGNKLERIQAWFDQQPRIGFSIMLQAAGVELLDQISEVSLTLGGSSDDIIKGAEGQLIELHRLERGSWPAWNGVGGSVRGQEWATPSAQSAIRVLTAERDSLFVARKSLRDLAAGADAQAHEVTIHGARLHSLMAAHDADIMRVRQSPTNPEELQARFLKLFMLRSGHLIDDLTPSDGEILERLRQIEDGRVRAEYQLMMDSLREMMPGIKISGDLEAAKVQFISAARELIESPVRAAAVKALFDSNYLANSPRLS